MAAETEAGTGTQTETAAETDRKHRDDLMIYFQISKLLIKIIQYFAGTNWEKILLEYRKIELGMK